MNQCVTVYWRHSALYTVQHVGSKFFGKITIALPCFCGILASSAVVIRFLQKTENKQQKRKNKLWQMSRNFLQFTIHFTNTNDRTI